jgi:hypothetical protein
VPVLCSEATQLDPRHPVFGERTRNRESRLEGRVRSAKRPPKVFHRIGQERR